MADYVYVASVPTGVYKIGVSSDPDGRMQTLSAQMPWKPQLEFLYRCDLVAREIEQKLHERFAATRVKGEWFKLDQAALEWLSQDPLPLPTSSAVRHATCDCEKCVEKRKGR